VVCHTTVDSAFVYQKSWLFSFDFISRLGASSDNYPNVKQFPQTTMKYQERKKGDKNNNKQDKNREIWDIHECDGEANFNQE
jgi:hypothetical protein